MGSKISKKIKKELPGVKINVLIKDYTTFKIGGPAKYFFVARKKEDLIKAVKIAKKNKLPFFILGGGSNVLFSDKGYKGLVIRILNSRATLRGVSRSARSSQILNSKLYAETGVKLDDLAKLAAKKSLTGFEWAAGIPGTIGGAVYGNTGAFGSSITDVVQGVEALDLKGFKVQKFNQKKCRFLNKDSIFKHRKNLVILSVIIKLKKGDRGEIRNEIKRHLKHRGENHPCEFPSAGCIFKNHRSKIRDPKLLKKYPELKEFNKGTRIPTAYLIDKSGLAGKKIGRAEISQKHANFVINLGGAKAIDVIKLIKLAKQKVKRKFGIDLKEEIQIIL